MQVVEQQVLCDSATAAPALSAIALWKELMLKKKGFGEKKPSDTLGQSLVALNDWKPPSEPCDSEWTPGPSPLRWTSPFKWETANCFVKKGQKILWPRQKCSDPRWGLILQKSDFFDLGFENFSAKTKSSVRTLNIKVLTIHNNSMHYCSHQGCPWAHKTHSRYTTLNGHQHKIQPNAKTGCRGGKSYISGSRQQCSREEAQLWVVGCRQVYMGRLLREIGRGHLWLEDE